MSTTATSSATRQWYNFRASATEPDTTELLIYDEIGYWGRSAKDFAADLAQVPAGNTLHLRINSPGGDVVEGTAIYNQLVRSQHHIVGHVDGIAASMASVILMAADRIEMPANAYLFVHNPWTMAAGNADEMRKTAADLDKMEANLLAIYATRPGVDVENIRTLMQGESLLTAAEALEAGLIDSIGDPVHASGAVRHFANPKLTAVFAAMATDITSQILPPEAPAEQPPVEPTPAAPAPVEPVAEPVPAEPAAAPSVDPNAAPEEPAAPATPAEARSVLHRFAAFLRGESAQASAPDVQAELTSLRDLVASRDRHITEITEQLSNARARTAELQSAAATLEQVMARCGVDPEALPGAVDILALDDPAQPTKPGITIKLHNQ